MLQELARRQDEAAALQAYRFFLVFFSVIFLHRLDTVKKE